MVSEPSDPEASSQAHRSRRFWLHLTDNLFRRRFLYLIPIVVAVAAGVFMVQNSQDEFTSSATLDASNNPLVGDLDLRGDDPIFRQTRAESTANFINEQLRTEAFASAVADAAGLDALIADGGITDTIRTQISVRANGDSIIIIEATWGDPASAQQLTQATIDTYLAYVSETVASDSLAAEEFFSELLQQAIERRDVAQAELNAYVATLPDFTVGEAQTLEATLTISRLEGALDRARAAVEEAETEIQAAQLAVAQAQSEAGLSVRLIDAPSLPFAPNSQLFAQLGLIVLLGLLGFAFSATILLITTAFDQTVRFEADVAHHTGSSFVASAPLVKSLAKRRGSPSSGRSSSHGKKDKKGRKDKKGASGTAESKSGSKTKRSSSKKSPATSGEPAKRREGAATDRSSGERSERGRSTGDRDRPPVPPPPPSGADRRTRRTDGRDEDRADSPAARPRRGDRDGSPSGERTRTRRRSASATATAPDVDEATGEAPDDDSLTDVER